MNTSQTPSPQFRSTTAETEPSTERIKISDVEPTNAGNRLSAWILGMILLAWYAFEFGRAIGAW